MKDAMMAFIHYWCKRGYRILRGERVQLTTVTPPAHRITDGSTLAERNQARIEARKQELGSGYILHPENTKAPWGWKVCN